MPKGWYSPSKAKQKAIWETTYCIFTLSVQSLQENLKPRLCSIDLTIAQSIQQGLGVRFSHKDPLLVNKYMIVHVVIITRPAWYKSPEAGKLCQITISLSQNLTPHPAAPHDHFLCYVKVFYTCCTCKKILKRHYFFFVLFVWFSKAKQPVFSRMLKM